MKKIFDWATRRLLHRALVKKGMKPKEASVLITQTKKEMKE